MDRFYFYEWGRGEGVLGAVNATGQTSSTTKGSCHTLFIISHGQGNCSHQAENFNTERTRSKDHATRSIYVMVTLSGPPVEEHGYA